MRNRTKRRGMRRAYRGILSRSFRRRQMRRYRKFIKGR